MGFWALAGPVIASVAGSLVSSKAQNDQASKIAGAQTDAATANAQTALAIYLDTVANARPDYIRGIQGGGLQMAASGLDPTEYYAAGRQVIDNMGNGLAGLGFGGGEALQPGGPAPKYGEPGYKPPTTDAMGTPSLTAMTGHNSSIFKALESGDAGNWRWWADGGPSVSAGLSQGIVGKLGGPTGADILDPGDGSFTDYSSRGGGSLLGRTLEQMGRKAGITTPLQVIFGKESRKDAPTNFAKYGTPEDNAAAAGEYDWAGYYDTQPDLQDAYENQNDTQKKWALASYDNNADGELGTDEFTQMWWNAHGKNNPDRVDGMTYFRNETPATDAGAAGLAGETGAAQPANGLTGFGSTDWEKAFRDSGFYKYGLGSAMRGADDLYQRAGASGTSLSGAQKRALDDRQTQIMGQGAFNNWYGSLSGQLPTGQLSNAGVNYGNMITDATNRNANALSGMYANQTDPYANAFGSAYRGIQQQQGWI